MMLLVTTWSQQQQGNIGGGSSLEPMLLELCRPSFRATSETRTTYYYSPHPRETLSSKRTALSPKACHPTQQTLPENCTETSRILKGF